MPQSHCNARAAACCGRAVVTIDDEGLMDAVTAVSGSVPLCVPAC